MEYGKEKRGGGIGTGREDRKEGRGRGTKVDRSFVQYCTEGVPRYMSGKGRRDGVRNKEGSMGSGKKDEERGQEQGRGFMTRDWVRVKKKVEKQRSENM